MGENTTMGNVFFNDLSVIQQKLRQTHIYMQKLQIMPKRKFKII